MRYIRSRALGMLVALCVLLAPVLSGAMDLHELAHRIAHLSFELGNPHDVSRDHESDIPNTDDDDAPAGLHAALHTAHCCGQCLGMPPSDILLLLSSASLSPIVQPAELKISVTGRLLFRPPRRV